MENCKKAKIKLSKKHSCVYRCIAPGSQLLICEKNKKILTFFNNALLIFIPIIKNKRGVLAPRFD